MARGMAVFGVLLAAAVSGSSGCSGDHNMMGNGMRSPGMMGPGSGGSVALLSVSPAGGASDVPVDSPILFRFSDAMAVGMEQYVDLHHQDLSGEVVPMSRVWSADRTLLRCTPGSRLSSRTSYAIHLGGGMTSASGQPIDYTSFGPAMGGQWIMGGMMPGNHAGMSWGRMTSGWRNANGSYGMVFNFTTR